MQKYLFWVTIVGVGLIIRRGVHADRETGCCPD